MRRRIFGKPLACGTEHCVAEHRGGSVGGELDALSSLRNADIFNSVACQRLILNCLETLIEIVQVSYQKEGRALSQNFCKFFIM